MTVARCARADMSFPRRVATVTLPAVSTVAEVVRRFESELEEFSAAFVSGRYALWLGSAISRERMPDVWGLLEKVVDFLRKRAFEEGSAGPHYKTLHNLLLDLADVDSNEPGVADFEQPCSRWPTWNSIVEKLADKYDLVLDQPVGTERADYLVWTGLDVPGTYADPTKMPDVEHYCIVVLLLEGAVTTAITANWDGLIEKALAELDQNPEAAVRVIVKQEDFRDKTSPKELIKFHGCAVLAAAKPDEYRDFLIARNPQVQRFKVDYPHTAAELEQRFSNHDALMIGLSTQDSNMHQMFSTAADNLKRQWEPKRPAVVLSEQTLRPYHRTVLTNTYSNYVPENRQAIEDSAVLGAFAKPVLVSLVLWTLTEKFVELLDHAPLPGLSVGERDSLKETLRLVRDEAAVKAEGGTLPFMKALIAAVSRVTHVFRTGATPTPDGMYEPLSARPISQAVNEQYFPTEALGGLAVVLTLLGHGMKVDGWVVRPGTHNSLADGVLQVHATNRTVRLFIVKDAEAWATLTASEDYDEDDPSVVVLYCGTAPIETREPAGRRTGKSGAALLRIADVCEDASCTDDLYAELKQVGGFV